MRDVRRVAAWGAVAGFTASVLLAGLASAGSAPAAPAATLDGLAWLVGGWKRASRSGSIHETWTRLSPGVLEGRSYRIGPAGGAPAPLEDLLLVEMGGEVFYISKVAENAYPVAFRLVTLEARAATFENPTHDFPQRIRYELRDDGSLLAAIEGPGEAGGEPRRIEFPFTRE